MLEENDDEAIDGERRGEPKKLGYFDLVFKPRVIFAAMAAMQVFIVYSGFEPTLSLRFGDYGLSQTYQGLIFAIQPTMYILGTLFTPFLLPKWMEIRVWFIIGLLLMAIGTVFVGPFFEDMNLGVMCFGLFFSGCFLGPLIIPNMAEMMQATKLIYPDSDLEHANSLLSGILNCCYGIGGSIGPLMSTALYQVSGFRLMCDIIGLEVIAFAILYFLTCKGCEAFSTTCHNYGRRHRTLSAIEQLTESAMGIRHSSAFKHSVISSDNARAMSKLSVISRGTLIKQSNNQVGEGS